MEHALELMPEIVGDESVGIKYAINGLLSLTPDGLPVLGETPEVGGLWSAAAVWVKEGPGVGRALAEWMVEGEPEIDLQSSDVARFHERQKSVAHVKARAAEHSTRPTGSSIPASSGSRAAACACPPSTSASARPRRGLLRDRRLGAPALVRVERRRCSRSTASERREAEWDARWWSPIINAEHLAMRDRAAIFDLTAFCVFDVVGPGALDSVQRVAMRQMDVKHRQGRLHAGAHAARRLPLRPHDHAARRRPLPGRHRRRARDGRPEVVRATTCRGRDAQIVDLTSSWCTLGLWGPRARDILASTTADDVSHEGFPFATLPRRSRWARCG